jgi:hypothetical protein
MFLMSNRILISAIVGVSLLMTSVVYMNSLSAGSEFLSAATTLSDASIISSQDESGYRLGDTITRAELAKVAANLGKYTPTSCMGSYYDVSMTL